MSISLETCTYLDVDPIDNQPRITEALKSVLQDEYNYDTTVSAASHQSVQGDQLRSPEFILRSVPFVYGMRLCRGGR